MRTVIVERFVKDGSGTEIVKVKYCETRDKAELWELKYRLAYRKPLYRVSVQLVREEQGNG